MLLLIIFAGILSLSLALYLTPLSAKAAVKLGIVAKPDGQLRTQTEPVPYLGGIAIYLSLLITLSVAARFNSMMLGLLLGITLILMVGLIDDFGAMTADMKLFGQFIAALALIKGGIVMELDIFRNINWPYDMPLVSWCLSAIWLIGIANAVNFLDIEDGLAGGIAACCCPALFVVALINQRADTAIFIVVLFGATMGFLRSNAPLPTAKIYLGDGGALFLGLAIAALAMTGSYTANNNIAAICPVIILGVPCFELGVTMAARWRRGIPVYTGSPDHVAKRLSILGFSRRAVLGIHWGASLLLGGIAIFIMSTDIKKAIIAVAALAALALVAAFVLLRVKVEWKPEKEDSDES